MNNNGSELPPDTAVPSTGSTSPSLTAVVEKATARWTAGDRPNARKIVDQHPALISNSSLLFDLVLADFECRRRAGDDLGPLTYREQFESFGPAVAASIERLIMAGRVAERFTPSDIVEWPCPGDESDGLLFVEEIGRGAFSRVYECRDRSVSDRRVAVKVTTQETVEVEQLSRLNHDHIVPVLTVKQSARYSASLIVMPFSGRQTLADFVSFSRGMNPDQLRSTTLRWLAVGESSIDHQLQIWPGSFDYRQFVLRIGAQVASALHYAHQTGIVHCDIKPSNILISQQRPFLIDFNLACPVANSGNRESLRGGTRAYMPPEFWEVMSDEKHREIGTRAVTPGADVYSLAVTIAEVLLGESPRDHPGAFDETSQSENRKRHLAILENCLSRLEPRKSLRSLLHRALSLEKQTRPSAAELSAELDRYVSAPTGISRRRALKYVAPFAASIAVIGVAGWGWKRLASQQLLEDARIAYTAHDYQHAEQLALKFESQLGRKWNSVQLIAYSRVESENVRGALDILLSYYEEVPRLECLRDLAYCEALAGDCTIAIGHYKKAMRDGLSTDYSLFNNLGCCYRIGRDSLIENDETFEFGSRSESYYRKAISLMPHRTEARINLVRLHTQRLLPSRLFSEDVATEKVAIMLRDVEELLAIDAGPQAKLAAALLISLLSREDERQMSYARKLLSDGIIEAPPRESWFRYPAFHSFLEANEDRVNGDSAQIVPTGCEPIWLPHFEG